MITICSNEYLQKYGMVLFRVCGTIKIIFKSKDETLCGSQLWYHSTVQHNWSKNGILHSYIIVT